MCSLTQCNAMHLDDGRGGGAAMQCNAKRRGEGGCGAGWLLKGNNLLSTDLQVNHCKDKQRQIEIQTQIQLQIQIQTQMQIPCVFTAVPQIQVNHSSLFLIYLHTHTPPHMLNTVWFLLGGYFELFELLCNMASWWVGNTRKSKCLTAPR